MAKTSAGLILYRMQHDKLEVLLVHPGGPFWRSKDEGAWFIAKGELDAGEEPLAGAKREFEEETGLKPEGEFLALGSVKQKSGKTIYAWAFEGDCDPSALKSNTFTIEWPPKSGRQGEFPEIDQAGFFSVAQAKVKMHPAEFPLVLRLQELLRSSERSDS
ncbi:MAG TPA: NUDIX domain-containing protein [Candidatus Acidoferrales bacterium]|nr:NUDIX domain-containing protein [Candidatus Acidoferrales bacterium]